MRILVAIVLLIGLCAGLVQAGMGENSSQATSSNLHSIPVAQVQAGAGYITELSTVLIVGAGAVSYLICHKRKRL